MIRINLVPQDILDREAQKQRVAQVGAAAGLVGLLIVGVSIMHLRTKKRLEAELAAAQAEAATLKDAKDKLNAAKARQSAVLKRREVLQGLLSARELYPVFMSDMIDVLPPSMSLETLVTKNTGPESLSVDINVSAKRPEDVASWLRGLNSSSTDSFKTRGAFSGAVLGGNLSIADEGNKFNLKMNYSLKR